MKANVMGDDSPCFFSIEMYDVLSASEGYKISIRIVFYYSDQVSGKATQIK